MKVILCEDVEHLGAIGAQVQVADGYARNFLIPRKLAVRADSASAKQIEHQLSILNRKEAKRRAELTAIAGRMKHVTLEFQMRAGEEDKLFGSVTNVMIAEQLAEKGYEVDRKKLVLDEPIKTLGIFPVTIKLGSGIECDVKVFVNKIEENTEQAAGE